MNFRHPALLLAALAFLPLAPVAAGPTKVSDIQEERRELRSLPPHSAPLSVVLPLVNDLVRHAPLQAASDVQAAMDALALAVQTAQQRLDSAATINVVATSTERILKEKILQITQEIRRTEHELFVARRNLNPFYRLYEVRRLHKKIAELNHAFMQYALILRIYSEATARVLGTP
jgi:hypothetical protein